ncbi:hypothetical protein, partial [Mycolicibacterium mageritense]|uniref:hypothetical protein n=1 Tax=Mycolicibacterium mageritense TaxID=53462 RepID=UPI001E36F55C
MHDGVGRIVRRTGIVGVTRTGLATASAPAPAGATVGTRAVLVTALVGVIRLVGLLVGRVACSSESVSESPAAIVALLA